MSDNLKYTEEYLRRRGAGESANVYGMPQEILDGVLAENAAINSRSSEPTAGGVGVGVGVGKRTPTLAESLKPRGLQRLEEVLGTDDAVWMTDIIMAAESPELEVAAIDKLSDEELRVSKGLLPSTFLAARENPNGEI